MNDRVAAFLRPVEISGLRAEQSMARAGSLSLVSIILQGVGRTLTALLVGRIAGPESLGIIGSALSLGALAVLLGPAALSGAASKFLARARGAQNPAAVHAAAHWLSAVTAGTLALLSILAVPAWMVLDGARVIDAAPVATLVLGMGGYLYTRGAHFGLAQVTRATYWDVATTSAGLVGTVALALGGVTGTQILWPMGIGGVAYTLACWPWAARKEASTNDYGEFRQFIALATIGTLCSAGLLQCGMLYAKAVSGEHEAGLFAAAVALTTPLSVLTSAISTALYPRMSAAFGRGDLSGVTSQTVAATRFLAVVLVPCFGLVALSAPILVHVVWGPRFDDAAALVPYFAVALLVNNLTTPAVNSVMSAGPGEAVVGTGIAVTGFVIGLSTWLLAGRQSIEWIAAGYLLGTATISLLSVSYASRRADHHWAKLWTLVAVAATILVAGPKVLAHLGIGATAEFGIGLVFSTAWLLVGIAYFRRGQRPRIRRGRHRAGA